MELSMHRQALAINETILNTAAEQAVESDLQLADYYPNIARVLRCHVETAPEQSAISGDRLIVDGTAVCHVHYRSEDGSLAKVTIKLPYSKSIELKRAPQRPLCYVTTSPGYFSCRVVNPRRIELRGAVVMQCKVISRGEQQVLSAVEGGGMQCRSQQLECAELLQWTQRTFLIRQDQELPEGNAAPQRILKCYATPDETDFKVIGGKIIAKTEVGVCILYRDDEGAVQRAKVRVPVSEIIDAQGLDEECICSVVYRVCWLDVQPKDTIEGDTPAVAVELCMGASIGIAKPQRCTAMPDCYSTRFQINTETRPVTTLRALPPLRDRVELNEKLDIPSEIEQVLELWADVLECAAVREQGSMKISGKLQVCMFASLEGGDIEYYDHIHDFARELPLDTQDELAEAATLCTVNSLEYKQSGSAVELHCAMGVELMLLAGVRRELITDVTLDESRPITQRNNGCLTLYFPQPGEQVWDIAKRYSTSPKMILEENDMAEDEPITRSMLLIPVIQ